MQGLLLLQFLPGLIPSEFSGAKVADCSLKMLSAENYRFVSNQAHFYCWIKKAQTQSSVWALVAITLLLFVHQPKTSAASFSPLISGLLKMVAARNTKYPSEGYR